MSWAPAVYLGHAKADANADRTRAARWNSKKRTRAGRAVSLPLDGGGYGSDLCGNPVNREGGGGFGAPRKRNFGISPCWEKPVRPIGARAGVTGHARATPVPLKAKNGLQSAPRPCHARASVLFPQGQMHQQPGGGGGSYPPP
eukprot:gene19443-biopygen22042